MTKIKYTAFTLVEMIVVVAVIAITISISFPFISDYAASQQFHRTVDSVINLLRTSQTNSQIQKNGATWGLCMRDGVVLSYAFDCDNQITGGDYEVPSLVTVTGLDDIKFSQIEGIPDRSTIITISTGKLNYYINIDEVGGFTQVPENELYPSTLTITTNLIPANPSVEMTYNFSLGNDYSESLTLNDQESGEFTNLEPGNYLMEIEDNPLYYSYVNCSDGFNFAGNAFVYPISSGENITCNFVHTLIEQSGEIEACIFNDKNENSVRDAGEEYFNDWEVKIDTGEWQSTGVTGCRTFQGLTLGNHTVYENLKDDYFNTTPTSIVANITEVGQTVKVEFGSKRDYLLVDIDAIICARESDLPNWGTGGPDITASSVDNFLNTHPSCHREGGWYFQWGYSDAANTGDNYIGEITNGLWRTIGPTDSVGSARVEVNDLRGTPYLWMRAVLKPNYYLFTYSTSGYKNTNNVTGEFYCHKDVMNYDNYDMINPVVKNQTYHCIFMNALK